MRAGSAKLDVTPKGPVMLGGYAGRDHCHEGIHDSLSLRALALADDGGNEAFIIQADSLWISGAQDIFALIESELGVSQERVILSGTHSHSAPSGRHEENAEYWHAFAETALAAAALARSRLETADIRMYRGTSKVNINRREHFPDGLDRGGREWQVWLGKNPDGPVDHELLLVSFDRPSGASIGRIINYGCHGTGQGQGNYLISGDWMGVAVGRIEECCDVPVLYLNGGAANVDPVAAYHDHFEPLLPVVDAFTADYNRTAAKEETEVASGIIDGQTERIFLPRKSGAVEEGYGALRPVDIKKLRIGDLTILSYPGEMFCQTAMAVKSACGPNCLVVSYEGASDRGYVPVREAYKGGGYEVMVSPYTAEAESLLRQGMIDLYKR